MKRFTAYFHHAGSQFIVGECYDLEVDGEEYPDAICTCIDGDRITFETQAAPEALN